MPDPVDALEEAIELEPPKTQEEFNRQMWRMLHEVRILARTTNGRVQGLERFRERIYGALAIVVLIAVPLFLGNVAK